MSNVGGSFGGSATAGRSASNTGTGRSSAERAAQSSRERSGGYKSSPDGRVFTSTSGLSAGISVSPNAEKQKLNRERMATYNSAAGKWNNSAKQRSFENFANAMSPMGFSMEPPDIARPATFGDGDYHMGWNPGSLVGFAGSLIAPGAGIPLGMAGQAAYTAMGGKNPILGGPGDMGMQTWDGSQSPANPTGAMTPGGGQLAGNTGSGNPMMAQALAGPASTPGGASFGAQPQAPQPPGMFNPQIANHSLPQGFQSMFPDSLTDEDKRLLYAKALMG